MQDLVLTLSKNLLKLSLIKKDTLSTLAVDIPYGIVKDTIVTDPEAFTTILLEAITKMQITPQKTFLTFVTEPNDAILKFVTVTKNAEDTEEAVVADAQAKFPELKLVEKYYSHEKIAPFVHQFVAIEKTFIDSIIKVSDLAGMSLKSVVPWVAVVPKYVRTSDPAIFVANAGGRQVIILSEMGGVFFTNEYPSNKSVQEITELVLELASYKRSKPIKNVYTLNFKLGQLPEDIKITTVEFAPATNANIEGFESNLLAHFVLDSGLDLLSSQLNLINLLPLPVVEEKNPGIVKYVKAGSLVTVTTAVLLFAVVFGLNKYKAYKEGAKLAMAEKATQVLSSQDSPKEASPSVIPTEAPKIELKREELTIRVENGSGINGMAAKTKTLLESKGYKVVEIDTAEVSANKTFVSLKENKLDFKELLAEDLQSGFGEVGFDNKLSSTAEYDTLITIGANVSL